MTRNVIVTGGAGYIGSHACKALAKVGYVPITFDNLSTGWRDAVKFGPFVQGDLLDKPAVVAAMNAYNPIGILHFAAFSQVGESVYDPGKYWRNNVLGSLNLIEAAVETGCDNFVFSSTCATYGDHDNCVLDEDCPQEPVNSYGASKRAIEEILSQFSQAKALRHVIFRYFNVAGADPDGEIGECHDPETHLIPVMIDAIQGKREHLTIFGTDYATPDGTCIRDYVHVCDLVDAHILGLEWMLNNNQNAVFNLGTGTGFSVQEVVDHGRRITNKKVPVVFGERRVGDCTKLVSASQRANDTLGWDPKRSDLETMISDAWRWHNSDHYER